MWKRPWSRLSVRQSADFELTLDTGESVARESVSWWRWVRRTFARASPKSLQLCRTTASVTRGGGRTSPVFADKDVVVIGGGIVCARDLLRCCTSMAREVRVLVRKEVLLGAAMGPREWERSPVGSDPCTDQLDRSWAVRTGSWNTFPWLMHYLPASKTHPFLLVDIWAQPRRGGYATVVDGKVPIQNKNLGPAGDTQG